MTKLFAFLAQHAYLLLFITVFVEQIGLPIPAAPMLLAAGAYAKTGQMNFALSLTFAASAALLADICWYEIGRWRGMKVLNLLCRISLEPDYCVRRTENTFARHGARVLMVAKFIPGVSAIATPMAGINGLSRARFLGYNSIGILLWIGSFELLGYLFSDQLTQIISSLAKFGGALLSVIIGGLAAYIAWKYTQRRLFLRRLRIARVSPAELKYLMDAGEAVFIVDLRHELEFASEPKMIPGALRMVMEEVEKRAHEIPRDRAIVLYCT